MRQTDQYRKSIRLQNYDYTSPGGYFVTSCSYQRKHLFGEIKDGQMFLNEWGEIVQRLWLDIPSHHHHVEIDIFVVMPNHIHGVLIFHDDEMRRGLPWQAPTESWQIHKENDSPEFGHRISGSLGSVIGMFKSAVTKQINDSQKTHGFRVWQRNYYERIVRNEDELNAIRSYIENNPKTWDDDEENQ